MDPSKMFPGKRLAMSYQAKEYHETFIKQLEELYGRILGQKLYEIQRYNYQQGFLDDQLGRN